MKLFLLLLLSLFFFVGCSKDQQDEEFLQQDESDDDDDDDDDDGDDDDDDDDDDDESDDQEDETVDVAALMATEIANKPKVAPKSAPVAKKPVKVTAQAKPSPVAKKAKIDPGNAKEFMWVFVDKAAIKPTPGNNGKSIAYVGYGEKVPVLSKNNGWVKVGQDKFIRIDKLTDRKKYQKKVSNVKYVLTPDLNIRSKPDRFSEIVGRLTKGEKVVVEKKSRDTWVKIGDGQYVNGKYLVNTPKKVDWAH